MIDLGYYKLNIFINGKDIADKEKTSNLYIHIPGGLDLPYVELLVRLDRNEEIYNYENQTIVVLFRSKYDLILFKFKVFKYLYTASQRQLKLFGISFLQEMSDSTPDYSESDSITAIKKFASSLQPDVEGSSNDSMVWIKSVSLRYTLETIWKHYYHSQNYLLLGLDNKLIGRTTDLLKSYKLKFSPTLKNVDYTISSNLTIEANAWNSLFDRKVKQWDTSNLQFQDKLPTRDTVFGNNFQENFNSTFSVKPINTDNVHPNWRLAELRNIEFLSRGYSTRVTLSEFAGNIPLLTPILIIGSDHFIDGIWIVQGKEYIVNDGKAQTVLSLWRDSL